MFTKPIRTFAFALTLIALGGTYLHAASPTDTTKNTVSNDDPTGGQPPPPGSSAVSIALMLLQMGIE